MPSPPVTTSKLHLAINLIIFCTAPLLNARPNLRLKRSVDTAPANDAVIDGAAQKRAEAKSFKDAFESLETGYNSCEMCVDFDGKGQCITMTEGQSKQSICLPSYAREEGCGKKMTPAALCGPFMNCDNRPLLPHGSEFKCKMPKPTAGNKLYKVYNSSSDCPKCQELHHLTGSQDKTPGCLLVDGDFACIKPSFYSQAEKDGTCNDKLCPKYSRCLAKEDNGGKNFLLKCMFDPKLLPKPPPEDTMKKAETILESILELTKITNSQMEVITGGLTNSQEESKKIEESILEKCPRQQPRKTVIKAEPVREDPLYRILKRTKRDLPGAKLKNETMDTLTCLMREKAIASEVASIQLKNMLSTCSGEDGEKDDDEKLFDEKCGEEYDKPTQPDLFNLCILEQAQKHTNSELKKGEETWKEIAEKSKSDDGPNPNTPKADAVKSEEPEADAVKSEEPEADAVKSEEPEADAVKSEEPEADAVKSEEPEADAVKSEEPVADAVKLEEPESYRTLFKAQNW